MLCASDEASCKGLNRPKMVKLWAAVTGQCSVSGHLVCVLFWRRYVVSFTSWLSTVLNSTAQPLQWQRHSAAVLAQKHQYAIRIAHFRMTSSAPPFLPGPTYCWKDRMGVEKRRQSSGRPKPLVQVSSMSQCLTIRSCLEKCLQPRSVYTILHDGWCRVLFFKGL